MLLCHMDPPLVPKDGRLLQVIVPVRVSDPTKQDERSLQDQRVKIENFFQERCDYPFELTVLEGRQSGELLDRQEFRKLVELAETRGFDAVIAEDLGRIVRRMQAYTFCETCVDHETRVIAINDHVDTARDGWQDSSIISAWRHERSNRDTSDRIKRTHRNRFAQGGVLSCTIYGYSKPPGARTDAELQRDPAAEPIYREWFRMLDEDNATFADVVRYLRTHNVPLPLHARSSTTEWDGKMVARHTFNPLLKGVRERNRRKSKRQSSGKYKSINAEPNELLQRQVPHLAFFEETYYDHVVAKVRDRNAKYRRDADGNGDPRRNVPRKQTRYPGQCTFCAICGRLYVFGGNGLTDHLMCSGSRLHQCWNGVTFDGPMASAKISEKVLDAVERMADFDTALMQMVEEEGRRFDDDRDRQLGELRLKFQKVENAIANVVKFITGGLEGIRRQPIRAFEMPSIQQIKDLARQSLKGLALDSPEFARQMRKLIPRIVVFPVRLCDDGAIVMRATFRVLLSTLLSERSSREVLRHPLEKIMTVDLFDPPQRELFRIRVVEARAKGMTERAIANHALRCLRARTPTAAKPSNAKDVGSGTSAINPFASAKAPIAA
jgi:site-specific DNA recombinase